MTGVEILAIKEVVTHCAFSWSAFFTILILVGMLGMFVFILFTTFWAGDKWNKRKTMGVLGGGLMFVVVIGFLFGVAFGTPSRYQTEYKVIVSDEVSMDEFFEKYKIVDQEGKIYTVRERMQDETVD